MSELTDALKIISNWMEAQHPFPVKDGQIIAPYRPGLSDTDITNLTDALPFELPQEVKEFYQWHNGDWGTKDSRFSDVQNTAMSEFLYVNRDVMYNNVRSFLRGEIIIFLSLDEAVSSFGYASEFGGKPYLPIFSEEDGYYSLLISESDNTPVLIGNHKIAFPSLTVLMQSIAELLENFDSLKSANTLPLTREEKLEFRDKLINEVARKYVEESNYNSVLRIFHIIITTEL